MRSGNVFIKHFRFFIFLSKSFFTIVSFNISIGKFTISFSVKIPDFCALNYE